MTSNQPYAPMQLRLMTRRLKMGARAIGMTRRALSLLVDHATRRETFGVKLSDRQAIQWWISTSTISRPSKAAPGGIWFK
jgi:acyl-CoA dehydrogenase